MIENHFPLVPVVRRYTEGAFTSLPSPGPDPKMATGLPVCLGSGLCAAQTERTSRSEDNSLFRVNANRNRDSMSRRRSEPKKRDAQMAPLRTPSQYLFLIGIKSMKRFSLPAARQAHLLQLRQTVQRPPPLNALNTGILDSSP